MNRKFRNMLGDNHCARGFTLIEAIIGMFVFTVGILAAVSMQVTAINGNSTARDLTMGANEAANEVENLRPLDYMTDDNLTEGIHGPIQVDNYTVTYNVQRNALLQNTMLVNITVNWLERGAPKTMNMVYIKHDTI